MYLKNSMFVYCLIFLTSLTHEGQCAESQAPKNLKQTIFELDSKAQQNLIDGNLRLYVEDVRKIATILKENNIQPLASEYEKLALEYQAFTELPPEKVRSLTLSQKHLRNARILFWGQNFDLNKNFESIDNYILAYQELSSAVPQEDRSIATVTILYDLARVYYCMEMFNEAETICNYALEICRSTSSMPESLYVSMLNLKGNLAIAASDYETAEPILLRALDILKAFNEEPATYSYAYTLALCDYAYLNLKSENSKNCLQLLDEIDVILKAHPESVEHQLCQIKANRIRGLCLAKMEDYATAKFNLEYSLNYMSLDTGRYYPKMLTETYEAILQCYGELDKQKLPRKDLLTVDHIRFTLGVLESLSQRLQTHRPRLELRIIQGQLQIVEHETP